MVTPVFVF